MRSPSWWIGLAFLGLTLHLFGLVDRHGSGYTGGEGTPTHISNNIHVAEVIGVLVMSEEPAAVKKELKRSRLDNVGS